MDGGVRRGTDVFKALALGAKAVLVCLNFSKPKHCLTTMNQVSFVLMSGIHDADREAGGVWTCSKGRGRGEESHQDVAG